MLSKTIYAIAMTVFMGAAAAEAEADRKAGACNESCGRALTEFNKCKRGKDYHNCLCRSGSWFHKFADPCLKCGDSYWQTYGHSLAVPMQECGMTLPGPIPAKDNQNNRHNNNNNNNNNDRNRNNNDRNRNNHHDNDRNRDNNRHNNNDRNRDNNRHNNNDRNRNHHDNDRNRNHHDNGRNRNHNDRHN